MYQKYRNRKTGQIVIACDNDTCRSMVKLYPKVNGKIMRISNKQKTTQGTI